MDDDYAFALQILDQLNGVEEFDPAYYRQRSDRIREAAERHDVDPEDIFAVLVDAIRVDIKEHPNQERLQYLLTKDT
ncbi:hypothetical protein [Pusillimonas sp.]|uniref:hypothetical protein n=1 Tax=Pusillimonas sp. TaxID=3040095 RepID=UPI0029BCFF66|nr:hypothetical protein [Pusillimonas sp.]MDX3894154.1 hypothetical protein [Pusillimonas sp.]